MPKDFIPMASLRRGFLFFRLRKSVACLPMIGLRIVRATLVK